MGRSAPGTRPRWRVLLFGGLCLLASLPLAAAVGNPVKIGNAVYVSAQGLHRFDADSGRLRWSSLDGIETFAPAAHVDGLILLGSTSGLYALDADSGKVVWQLEKGRTIFSPRVAQRAYAGSAHGELYAIDVARGRIAWRQHFTGWIYSPAVDRDAGLLWTGGQQHRIYGLALADGSLRHEIETSQEIVFSPLAIGAGRVAFNLFDGNTVIIDARRGEVDAIIAGDTVPTALHRRGREIFRTHGDGSLVAFDNRRLQIHWRLNPGGSLRFHPALPGYLLLGDGDREIVLLDLGNRERICRLHDPRGWILPMQVTAEAVLRLQNRVNPPALELVQLRANCKKTGGEKI